MTAVKDHDRDRRTTQGLHHRRGPRSRPTRTVDQRKKALEETGGATLLVSLHTISFDMAGALKGLAQQRRQLADLGLGVGRNPPDSPADADDRMDRQREHEERDQ